MLMFNQTIVVLKAPAAGKDRMGNTVRDWPNAARVTYDNVSVQPRISTESLSEPRDQTITGWRIQSRAGVDIAIDAVDRVEWADWSLEVVGEVARWPHPIKPNGVHHVEVDVQRVRG